MYTVSLWKVRFEIKLDVTNNALKFEESNVAQSAI